MKWGLGPFWTYILQNHASRFYIGHTDDLDRRLTQHNDTTGPKASFTSKHGPWTLVWAESHPTRAAMARERFIKSRKSSAWIRSNLLNPENESR